jgi:hypothetical protein
MDKTKDEWEVVWYERGGDTCKNTVEFSRDTNTFKVIAELNKGGGMWRVANLKKVRRGI